MNYQLSRDGQQFGPYTLEDIHRYLASGNILLTDLVKGDTMPDWVPVSVFVTTGAPHQAPPPLAIAPGWQGQSYAGAPLAGQLPFFPVTVLKYVVMSLVTFGLYHVYWAYQNWVRIQAATGQPLIPWARALFLGIWNFSLFPRVKERATVEGITAAWNPVLLGVFVLVFAAFNKAPGAWSAIVMLGFVPYLPVVATTARINAKYAEQTSEGLNSRFTGGNIAWIIIGGLLLLLAMVGWVAMATGYAPSK